MISVWLSCVSSGVRVKLSIMPLASVARSGPGLYGSDGALMSPGTRP